MPRIEEVVLALGHPNIQALHRSTIEITKEKRLTRSGDCVIAVSADKSVSDLRTNFRDALQNEGVKLSMLIEAGGVFDSVMAYGSQSLVLKDPQDLVLRKSNYICSRTLAVCADKAALDLSRNLVEQLKKPARKVKITLRIEP